MGSLEIALIFIGILAALTGVIVITVGATGAGDPVAGIGLVALAWIWAVAGIIAWWRRPTNGIGPLLLIGAVSVFLVSTGYVGAPGLFWVNAVFATTPLGVAIHLLMAFPSGRVRGRLAVLAVVLGYVTCIVFDTARALTEGTAAFELLSFLQSVLGLTSMALAAIVLARRLRAADAAHRRVLLPLFTYGLLAVVCLPLLPNLLFPMGVGFDVVVSLQGLLLAGLPIAFLLGVLRGGFTRTTPLEALSEWLAIRGASRPAVAQALATTVGDDTLRVAYWDASRGQYIDERGERAPVDPDAADPDRAWLQVRVDDELVGGIEYDARMIAEPWPVRRAAEVLAIALDRERLTTQLLVSNEALTRSRVRIVDAADRERSRIARDLHDGLQMQLVLLGIEAQTIADAAAESATTGDIEKLRRGIDLAAADLRRLVHDVLPAALLERGLVAATEDLVDRLSVPATLVAQVDETAITTSTAHTAYFIIAEALSNTVKHADASHVRVTLDQRDGRIAIAIEDDGVGGARIGAGVGLRGLADRVDALQGTIAIRSEPLRGTNIEVELPCAS
ncbi:ATP-binding protein [Microbacterium sp. TPD7012]|uniref:sensor histidine kinase n=1 Tax=Microbacterium sp. TPD7012 TaxID=2171975 RepID=UPI000D524C0A|nr:ATP-binding protein [Microbacterium sp. TPD7012]PVE94786.1 ATPase [Microbacterium sp. TPD7012]